MLKKLMISILLFSIIFCTYTGQMLNNFIQQSIEMLEPQKREMGLFCISSLKKIYKEKNYRSLWNDSIKINSFINMIQNANVEGLEPNNYHIRKLKKYESTNSPDLIEKARFDILLTDSFLLYASHLLSGKVNPNTIDAQWHVTRKEGDPIRLFFRSWQKKDMNASLNSILSDNIPYQKLKQFLMRYREIQKKNGWKSIPKGPVIRPQNRDSRIPLIRNRLTLSGDYSDRRYITSTLYDQTLQNAVKNFQKRHGLVNKGIIGEQTIREMNISVQTRIDQIKVNMERYRWLPQKFSQYYLLVNIADFTLVVIKDQRVVISQKIIVGKPFKKTPAFSSKIYHLFINPTWTIPTGIVQSDIIPAMQKRKDYLTKQHIIILNNKRKQVDAKDIDWSKADLNNYLFRQKAGRHNALGVIKFMFPNPFAIYLHDTPSKNLFERSSRAFSAGCIRLQRPIDLALILLEDQPAWNVNSIKKAIASEVTQKVILSTRPEIHLIYLTAWVDEKNTLQFRSDIYSRDTPLLNALKAKLK